MLQPPKPELRLIENIAWHSHRVSREARSNLKSQKPCLIRFTGLSGSGKSTVANAVDGLLHGQGYHTYVLDGDNVRHRLNKLAPLAELSQSLRLCAAL
ncbi:adenylyl-sulfate kinase [Endozoicomonas sp. ALD040]|uniref:adenylyl-sulfate kinase n=1 Tax=unclassified Endozoicomonas TaxID=2644528 RepID=UPI003BB0DE5E